VLAASVGMTIYNQHLVLKAMQERCSTRKCEVAWTMCGVNDIRLVGLYVSEAL